MNMVEMSPGKASMDGNPASRRTGRAVSGNPQQHQYWTLLDIGLWSLDATEVLVGCALLRSERRAALHVSGDALRASQSFAARTA